MDFHFFTSDYKQDYPEIGWIPQLESEPWSQWDAFHKGEYPELILFQYNGNWTLYVNALDSGRIDYVNRVIRLSWMITGNVTEGSQLFGFLRRIVPSLGKNDVMLQNAYIDLLSSQIHEGDPEKWRHESPEEKQRIANELGKALLEPSPSDAVDWSEPNDKWYGGDNDESRDAFMRSCFYLLTTEVSAGAAISLTKLGVQRIQSDFSLSSSWDKLAVLISDNVPKSPMPEPVAATPPEPTGLKRYIKAAAIALTSLVLGLGIGVPVYNNHSNHKAIDQIEQSAKQHTVVNPVVIKRAETLEKKNVRAKNALDAYFISLVEKALQDGETLDNKALDRVLNLAQTDPSASYVAGCYYYSNNNLKAAKECFAKAAKEGVKDSSAKLEEINKKLSDLE